MWCSHFRSREFPCDGERFQSGIVCWHGDWFGRLSDERRASIVGYYQRRYVVTSVRLKKFASEAHDDDAFSEARLLEMVVKDPTGPGRKSLSVTICRFHLSYGHERLERDSCHSLNTSEAHVETVPSFRPSVLDVYVDRGSYFGSKYPSPFA